MTEIYIDNGNSSNVRPSFIKEYESNLMKAAKLISWCPTMDLFAVVSVNDNLSLYREGNQKVWTVDTPNDRIIAITWRPDGQEMAVAYYSGKVMKTGVAFPEPTWSPCTFSSISNVSIRNAQVESMRNGGITYISWFSYSSKPSLLSHYTFDPDAINVKSLLPDLHVIAHDDPIPTMPFRKKKIVLMPIISNVSTKSLSLLLVGTKKGEIYMSFGGSFYAGSLNLQTTAHSPGEIMNICSAPDMSSIQVLSRHHSNKRKVESQDNSYIYTLSAISMPLLQERREELCNITNTQINIVDLLRYIQYSIGILDKHYKVHTTMNKRQIENMMCAIDSNSDNAQRNIILRGELQTMLATGYVPPALINYFMEELSEKSAKQWNDRVSYSYKACLRIIAEYILPANDRLGVYLSELYGYSHWKERYEEILDKEIVEKCIALSGLLTARVRGLVEIISRLLPKFEAFMEWILSATRSVSDKKSGENDFFPVVSYNPKLVFDYLKGPLAMDDLIVFFNKSPGSDSLDLVDQYQRGIFAYGSLGQIVEEQTKACETMLAKLSRTRALNTGAKRHDWVLFDSLQMKFFAVNRETVGLCVVSYTVEKQIENYEKSLGEHYIAFTTKDMVVIVRNPFISLVGEETVLQEPCYACISVDHDISDMQFIDDKELAIILQPTMLEDNANPQLVTIHYRHLNYSQWKESLMSGSLAPTNLLDVVRSVCLQDLWDAILGINGSREKRIANVIGSNGKTKVFYMKDG
ncbi:anaphase-promoting complex, cyclosome, subunit 4-domain-containing protein [Spinellus fusiger]|nr:anaphase-promoting complex, cyclosome, subunit 4-domain-containing protein [Spinellus fusiger]